MRHNALKNRGFTLIELSIVLVIIGLIVGGVVVGRDLIKAATLRSQISQIEQYQTAVNVFKLKYNALPGDLTPTEASTFGLASRTGSAGRGNGNQVLDDYTDASRVGRLGTFVAHGEKGLFWRDLSETSLIKETLNTASSSHNHVIEDTLPKARIDDNWVGVWSGGYTGLGSTAGKGNSKNYYVLSKGRISSPYYYSATGMTSSDALSIDSKSDDGLPQSGKVTAMFPHHNYGLYVGTSNLLASGSGKPPGVAMTASENSCFDNNNIATDQKNYTLHLGQDVLKCALSFEFQ